MYAQRLQETLPRTRETIAQAAIAAGRDPDHVTLVAVTKSHPLEAIHAALDAGLTELGENRVGELVEKAGAVQHPGVRWHMIGHIQSRKAKNVVGVADLIHSMDRRSLAEKLSRLAVDRELRVPVLVQVNTSGEEAKGGFGQETAVEDVLEVAELPGLDVRGLMTMAPFVDEEALLRSTFRGLRRILEEVRSHNPRVGPELSMGMSNDLEYAVAEGSTMVRIGTALFGPRPEPAVR